MPNDTIKETKPADKPPVRFDLIAFVCLGVIGLWFFFCKMEASFPAASIDLKLPKSQISQKAKEWCDKLGYRSQGAITSTVFNYDDDSKIFLEYELGQSKANALMRSDVPVWSWQTRFCRPFEIEELSVGLSPDGALNYFSHALANDAPAPYVSHDQAQKIARQFVEQTVGRPLTNETLIRDSEDKQLKRTDHQFTFEDKTRDYKGGLIRTQVSVAGDKVIQYYRYLHVPEKFERKFAEIRSHNELLKSISSIVYIGLSSAIAFIFVWAFAAGRIRWKFAFSVAAGGLVLNVLSFINGWPSLVSGYETTMTFQQYITNAIAAALMSSAYSVVACLVFIAALEPIYRMTFPKQVALERIATFMGLRSTSIVQGLVVGLSVFGMHVAYVVTFYLFGQKLGFWSPLEVREASTLSGLWPAFTAIYIGVTAATTEEFMYRVLGLAAFQRLTGNFWIANLLQAASWGFMHSDYPQQPAYVRGVELTICGFFYGFILRRYGLLACILAHYTYDAFLGVVPLLSSPLLSNKLSALVAVLPGLLLLSATIYAKSVRGSLQNEEPILNAAIVSSPNKFAPEPLTGFPDYSYEPLARKKLIAIVGGAMVALLAVVCVQLHTVGDVGVIQINRQEAIARAISHLESKGVSVVGRTPVAWLHDDTDETALQYVFEKENFAKTATLVKSLEPRLVWKVRFLKPEDPQEYYVTLTPDGKPISVNEIEEEDATGASPDQQKARTLVEGFLQGDHPEYKPYVFEDATKHERKDRTDYNFTYRIPQLKVADADFKVYSGTVGGAVSGFSRSWQIPDAWLFERQKVKEKDQIVDYISYAYRIGLFLLMLWFFVDVMRSGFIRWRVPIVLAVATSVVFVVRQLNILPLLLYGYQTEVSLSTYLSGIAVQDLNLIVSGAAAFGLGCAFSIGAYYIAFPDKPLGALFKAAVPGKDGQDTRRFWRDAVIIGYGCTLILTAIDHLFDVGQYLTSPSVHSLALGGARALADEWSPALGAVLNSFSSAITVLLGACALAGIYRKFFKNRTVFLPVGFAVVSGLIMYGHARYWQDYAWSVSCFLVMAAAAAYMIIKLFRFNVAAYLLAGYCSVLLGVLATLWRHTFVGWHSVYMVDFLVLVGFLAAPAVWTAWLYLIPVPKTATEELALGTMRIE